MKLLSPLREYVDRLVPQSISEARKGLYAPLIEVVGQSISQGDAVDLVFVCTHNSRRSHIARVWAEVMSVYYDISGVRCYSAGTEATAVYPQVLKALEAAGMESVALSDAANPVYMLRYTNFERPQVLFSKTLSHPYLPPKSMIAVMVCDTAAEACPFVPGASARFAISFTDPKAYDDTDEVQQRYEAKSLEIATEIKYLMSEVKAALAS